MEGIIFFIRRYSCLMWRSRLRSDLLRFSFLVTAGESLSLSLLSDSEEVSEFVGGVGILASGVLFLVIRGGAMPVFVFVFVIVVVVAAAVAVVSVPLPLPVFFLIVRVGAMAVFVVVVVVVVAVAVAAMTVPLPLPVFFVVVRIGAMAVVVVVVVSVPLALSAAVLVVVFAVVIYRCGSGDG